MKEIICLNDKMIKNLSNAAFACVLSAFFFAIVSIIKSSEYANANQTITSHYLFVGLFALTFFIGNGLYGFLKKRDMVVQFCFLNLFGVIVFGTLIITKRQELYEYGREGYLKSYLNIIAVNLLLLFGNIYFLAKSGLNFQRKKLIKKEIFILAVIMGIIAVSNAGSAPRWDAAYLFRYVYDRCVSQLFNLEALQFCGHLSMGYIGINMILGYITGSLELGMTIGNITLYLISIFCVYGIIKETIKDKKEIEYALLTAIYACSPFLLGLVNYNYWDYWTMVLFPIIVYSALKGKWIFHFVMAFIFIFTKETALVSYAFWCVGVVAFDKRIWEKNIPVQIKLRSLISDKRYIGMFSLGLIWLMMWRILPHWDGVGGFTIDFSYIGEKLVVFYIFNFSWVLTILCIGLCIRIMKTRNVLLLRIVGPIMMSDIALVLFNCFFDTINHPRYIDTHIVVLCLMAAIEAEMLTARVSRILVSLSIISILFISNFTTFDFISKTIFTGYDFGKSDLLATSDGYISDAMVYNQQYRYLDKALNRALEDAIYEEEAIICFPTLRNNTWYFDGVMGEYSDIEDYIILDEYWDKKNKLRVAHESDNTVPIRIYQLPDGYPLEQLASKISGYYFYLPCLGKDIRDELEKNVDIIEENVFEYRGVEVIRIKW